MKLSETDVHTLSTNAWYIHIVLTLLLIMITTMLMMIMIIISSFADELNQKC